MVLNVTPIIDIYFFTTHLFRKDDDKYCDELAKKCKAGDKDACKLYKKKCGKVNMFND